MRLQRLSRLRWITRMAPAWSRCLFKFYKFTGIRAAIEQHCEAIEGEEGGITKALREDAAWPSEPKKAH